MSKLYAVAGAITTQLHIDGRWPPIDLNKLLSDYNYTVYTLGIFLDAVRYHLEHGTPSFSFDPDPAFAKSNLASSVAQLIGNVDTKTSPAPQAIV